MQPNRKLSRRYGDDFAQQVICTAGERMIAGATLPHLGRPPAHRGRSKGPLAQPVMAKFLRHPHGITFGLANGHPDGVLVRKKQSGQVMVLVAVSRLALIGSAALVSSRGIGGVQKNQLQQLADQAALDSALKISVGCDAGKATTIITAADTFLATQRTRPVH